MDYLSRDKKYYGYPEESALVPCTIQGIDWSTVKELSSYLIAGEMDEKLYIGGEEILAVVWAEEYENAEYPVQIGDTVTLSNLVRTEASSDYWEKPDEAKRIDTTAKIGGIIKLPLALSDELCAFRRGSFTFLRSLDALERDGHDISFQSILFDYAKGADMRAVDREIEDIVSAYSYVSFESRYEKQKAAEEFKKVVYILGGSICT